MFIDYTKYLTRVAWLLLMVAGVMGCSPQRVGEIERLVLFAPFEGRYSEVGYNTYYAVQLALRDAGREQIELLAVDDGGSVEQAVERARAIALDPLVKVVISSGYPAADEAVQAALGDVPILIAGQWESQPASPTAFMLASAQLDSILTTSPSTFEVTGAARMNIPIVGGDVYALEQFPRLSRNFQRITVVSSASLPDEAFQERYRSMGLYVPEPGLLATLTYDATGMALEAMASSEPAATLATMRYEGLNGSIHFEDGYWADAPIRYYGYDENGALIPIDGLVE